MQNVVLLHVCKFSTQQESARQEAYSGEFTMFSDELVKLLDLLIIAADSLASISLLCHIWKLVQLDVMLVIRYAGLLSFFMQVEKTGKAGEEAILMALVFSMKT